MLECKPVQTLMDCTKKLEIIEGSSPVDEGRYQKLKGKLIYLSHTQPDIGFNVSVVSQYMYYLRKEHLDNFYVLMRVHLR